MSVKVAVRCRPLNRREAGLHSGVIVEMKACSTLLYEPGSLPPATAATAAAAAAAAAGPSAAAAEAPAPRGAGSAAAPRQFTFDHSFWSVNEEDEHFASQERVYEAVGREVLENAFAGYNACVFAYGQTGAGKSFSMMGSSDNASQRGLIPRLCEELFARSEAQAAAAATGCSWTAKIEVSYMEIYLEKVKDLLNPESQHTLKVRENASTGPYVEGLSSHAVTDFKQVKALMDDGNQMRTVKATIMNDVSSRSHAIFQLVFTQTELTERDGEQVKTERVSRISMVDLAGSERSGTINAGRSDRLKEGNVINLSLSTLGKVISTLADRGKGKKGVSHVPYRESTLTWLLKDSLGGNSKTLMLAAISPAADNYEETLSTLRYANQAKNIVNRAVVNEDATATMVRKLNEEIEQLRKQLAMAQQGMLKRPSVEEPQPAPGTAAQLQQAAPPLSSASGSASPNRLSPQPDDLNVDELASALEESERLMDELTRSWEDKLERTVAMQEQRTEALRHLGILINDGEDTPVGVMAPRYMPYLLKLSAGGSADECLVYYLKEGLTVVVQRGISFESEDGSEDEPLRLIELDGEAIQPEHCEFHCVILSGETMVSLVPLDAETIHVNNRLINKPLRLKSGDIIYLSDAHIFRFDNPEEPRSGALVAAMHMVGLPGVVKGSNGSQQPHPIASRQGSFNDGIGQHDATPTERNAPAVLPDMESAGPPVSSPSTKNTPGLLQYTSPLDGSSNLPVPSTPESLNSSSASAAEMAQVSAALTEARFEYQPEDEDNLLSALITDILPQHTPFKLLPAYGVYLMCRHCQSLPNAAEKVSGLLSKAAVLVSMNVMNAPDVAALTFWLANASELGMALRSDYTLAAYGCAEPQQQLAETTQEAFTLLLAEVKRRLKPGVPALLADEAGVNATSAPASPGLNTSRSSSSGGNSSGGSLFFGKRQQAPGSAKKETAVNGSSSTAPATGTNQTSGTTAEPITGPAPTAAALNGSAGLLGAAYGLHNSSSQIGNGVNGPQATSIQYLITTLDATLQAARSCLVSSSVVDQLMDAAFYYIGAEAFNVFIADKSLFRCDMGLSIRYNLSVLTDWANRHGFKVERQLRHLTEASQLLQMQKTSLQYLDRICQGCAHLNSLQMEKILRNYKPAADEGPVPATVIDCVKGRFMASYDEEALEDESVGNKVQLQRNADFALPFRLTGESHMSRRLSDQDIVRSIKTQIVELLTASTDTGSDTSSLNRESPSLVRSSRVRRKAAQEAPVSAAQWASLDLIKSAGTVDSKPAAHKRSFFDHM